MPSIARSEHGATTYHQVAYSDPAASIPLLHIDSMAKFTLTPEEIDQHRDDNLQHLLDRKKLHLILDLDHTLVHSRSINSLDTQERQYLESIDDAYKILDGTFVVKLRPGVHEFLKQVNSMCNLSIYTKSMRIYAQEAVALLDSKDGPSRFSRVITREDCLMAGQKGLDIVLSHERVVLIVDDIKEIWEKSCHENIIQIEPYNYSPSKKESTGMDEELARVLRIIGAVHDEFYGNDYKKFEVDYRNRDVRDVLQMVMSRSKGRLSYLIWAINKKSKRLLNLGCNFGFSCFPFTKKGRKKGYYLIC